MAFVHLPCHRRGFVDQGVAGLGQLALPCRCRSPRVPLLEVVFVVGGVESHVCVWKGYAAFATGPQRLLPLRCSGLLLVVRYKLDLLIVNKTACGDTVVWVGFELLLRARISGELATSGGLVCLVVYGDSSDGIGP